MNRIAVGIMTRAPSSGGKSRLAGHVREPRLQALRAALLVDTVYAVLQAAELAPFIFFTPPHRREEMEELTPAIPLVAQRGNELGERMRHALARLVVDSGFSGAMVIGADVPLLSPEHLLEAAAALRERPGIVLGPAEDGGYYLIGMTEPHDALLEDIPWGAPTVLADTIARAEPRGIAVHLLRAAYDVDTIDDLRRAERDLAGADPAIAPNLRAWFSAA